MKRRAASRRTKTTQHVPIIAVTAHARPVDERRALEAGCDAYLSKPYSLREFLDIVQKFLPISSGDRIALFSRASCRARFRPKNLIIAPPASPAPVCAKPPALVCLFAIVHSRLRDARRCLNQNPLQDCRDGRECQVVSAQRSWYTLQHASVATAAVESLPQPCPDAWPMIGPSHEKISTSPHIISQGLGVLEPFTSRHLAGLPLVVLALVTLACGSFVPRPTPIPRSTITPIVEAAAAEPLATDTPSLPTSVPTRVVPTPTFTPTPVPGTVIAVGQSARVVAGQGLNVRKSASATGNKAGAMRQTPSSACSKDLWTWTVIARGTSVTTNSPVGWPKATARSFGLARTLVELNLSLERSRWRYCPGGCRRGWPAQGAKRSRLERQGPTPGEDGVQLKVDEGPVEADGYRWWKLSGVNDVSGWAAEGSGDEKWLKPLE